jgi:intracellular sulfur oxidation DsrE/DsrF family protein
MNGKGLKSSMARRSFLARLGAGTGVVGANVISSPVAETQGPADAPWRPARHTQDDGYDKIPGVHRFLFDTSTAESMRWALHFVSNYLMANQEVYGLKDSDLPVLIVARHNSTSFAYSDAIWAKDGKQLSEQAESTDPKTQEPPKINVYGAAGETAQAGKMNALIKKGVQFAVCQMSSRGIAGRIAKTNGVETDNVVKEIAANLLGNAHTVSAGILAADRAQGRGQSFIYSI